MYANILPVVKRRNEKISIDLLREICTAALNWTLHCSSTGSISSFHHSELMLRAMDTEEVTGKPHSIEDSMRIDQVIYLKDLVFPVGTVAIAKDIIERMALLILQYSSWSASAEHACICCSESSPNGQALLPSCRVMTGQPMWGGCLSCALQGSICSFTSSAPPHKYGAAPKVTTILTTCVIFANANLFQREIRVFDCSGYYKTNVQVASSAPLTDTELGDHTVRPRYATMLEVRR
jgi:hypothetical protein